MKELSLLWPTWVAPAWAWKVLCEEAGDLYDEGISLLWVQRKRTGSSGFAHKGHYRQHKYAGVVWVPTGIVIQAGTDERRALRVLLHEIAHHRVPWDSKKMHGREFCCEAVRLYKKYGLLQEIAEGPLRCYYKVEQKAVEAAWREAQ